MPISGHICFAYESMTSACLNRDWEKVNETKYLSTYKQEEMQRERGARVEISMQRS